MPNEEPVEAPDNDDLDARTVVAANGTIEGESRRFWEAAVFLDLLAMGQGLRPAELRHVLEAIDDLPGDDGGLQAEIAAEPDTDTDLEAVLAAAAALGGLHSAMDALNAAARGCSPDPEQPLPLPAFGLTMEGRLMLW